MSVQPLNLIRKPLGTGFVHLYRSAQVIFGFTELGVSLENINELLHAEGRDLAGESRTVTRQLKQVHSGIVKPVSVLTEREEVEGDGIILDQRDLAAVIRTADCTPLFIWNDSGTAGGVIHVGWRGLLEGIELAAIRHIGHTFPGVSVSELNVFLGPAIEQACYEVGEEVYGDFSDKHYRSHIFRPVEQSGKFLLDVKKGVALSLQRAGVSSARIFDSGICTYCETERFPSYRRLPGSGQRIYNFMLLK